MTIDDLREYAKQTLREMKDQLKRTGEAKPLFRAYYADGRKNEFKFPPGTEGLMNSGEAKEIIFDLFRKHTEQGGVRLWIFAHDANRGQVTEEGKKHLDELNDHYRQGMAELQAMGWVVVEEVLHISVQDEKEILHLTQVYVRGSGNQVEFIGPPQEERGPQSEFEGRTKMFGATRGDITGNDPSRSAGPVGFERLLEKIRR